MCDFCDNFDFGRAACVIEKFENIKQASIIFSGGSSRFDKNKQFKFCPECGKKLNDEKYF